MRARAGLRLGGRARPGCGSWGRAAPGAVPLPKRRRAAALRAGIARYDPPSWYHRLPCKSPPSTTRVRTRSAIRPSCEVWVGLARPLRARSRPAAAGQDPPQLRDWHLSRSVFVSGDEADHSQRRARLQLRGRWARLQLRGRWVRVWCEVGVYGCGARHHGCGAGTSRSPISPGRSATASPRLPLD